MHLTRPLVDLDGIERRSVPTIVEVSKTKRALDSDAAALDELDDFVAAEAAAADRAIGELIDEAVEPTNGSSPADSVEYEIAHVSGSNGFDSSGLDVLDEPDSALDMSELDIIDDGPDSLQTGEVETLVAADSLETGENDVPVGADSLAGLDVLDEVESESFELEHLEALVETEDGVADDEVPAALVETQDDVPDGVSEEPYELPVIVPATDEVIDDQADDAEVLAAPDAREGDLDEVSDDILEELRRADIDGPIVDFAPQDDTSSAPRRPKRRPDYDPAPVPIPARPPRILGRKPRVRKVTRVVRHVDPWSVFKIAAVAFMVLYVVLLTAGVLLWNVAYATGTVDNVERFFESFGWSSFEFNGGEIYHASWIMGLFSVVGLTGMAVLSATLFNLITDIVGGMRFTVLEEEVVETRTSPMRRFVVRRPEPEVPVVVEDSSGAMIREAVVDDSGAIER
jgi:hypothetical protein